MRRLVMYHANEENIPHQSFPMPNFNFSYDLAIARTDNQVDMRYLINMDYSADLPINSMGRRVRSRLYFTSESHLHSMLNVLRFPSIVPTPLSLNGQEILANASELCYLTQVVIRLFEDTQKPPEDPRRFRVEIMFSPGATATPLHMAELYREKDASRFDTEKLQKISFDGLTCAQVEAYFTEAIKEGKIHEDDDEHDNAHPAEKEKEKKKDKTPKKEPKEVAPQPLTEANARPVEYVESTGNGTAATMEGDAESSLPNNGGITGEKSYSVDSNNHIQDDSDTNANEMDADGKFWRRATILSAVVGAGCLILMSRALKRR